MIKSSGLSLMYFFLLSRETFLPFEEDFLFAFLPTGFATFAFLGSSGTSACLCVAFKSSSTTWSSISIETSDKEAPNISILTPCSCFLAPPETVCFAFFLFASSSKTSALIFPYEEIDDCVCFTTWTNSSSSFSSGFGCFFLTIFKPDFLITIFLGSVTSNSFSSSCASSLFGNTFVSLLISSDSLVFSTTSFGDFSLFFTGRVAWVFLISFIGVFSSLGVLFDALASIFVSAADACANSPLII